jgi:hypothetical protein
MLTYADALSGAVRRLDKEAFDTTEIARLVAAFAQVEKLEGSRLRD